MVRKRGRKRKANWSKKAKSVGDDTEYLVRNYLRAKGYVAIRICHSQQVKDWSKVDIIFFDPKYGGLVQAKRRKHYMTEEDKMLLRDSAMNKRTAALLAWRDKGAKFEFLCNSSLRDDYIDI